MSLPSCPCVCQELRVCALAALLNLTYHNPTAQVVVATMRVMPTILAFLDDAECVGSPVCAAVWLIGHASINAPNLSLSLAPPLSP
jgi:hypothetical protein